MTEQRKDRNQGEGNRDAAEEYNEKTREFVESGRSENAPDPAAQPDDSAQQAEEKGKSRARELDPEVHREYDKPVKE
jgi:hypothetical protein